MVAISAKSHFLHLVMLTFLLSLPASRGEGEQQQRPNVLFMIVDDLNDMPLHPDGKPFVATPNFDRLAARGMSFTNGIATTQSVLHHGQVCSLDCTHRHQVFTGLKIIGRTRY